MEETKKSLATEDDEILVKGTDGKWYVLRGEELVPYEKKGLGDRGQGIVSVETPKGVSVEKHQQLEKSRKIEPSRTASLTPSTYVLTPAISHEGHPLVKELDELIDQAVAESQKVIQSQIPPWDAVLQKRFRVLVSARLRDVRDALETKSLLTREVKIGGMGLKEAEAQTLLTVIETKFKEFSQKWRAEEAHRIAEWKNKQLKQREQLAQQEQRNEEEDLEKRHFKLLGQAGAREKVKPPLTPTLSPYSQGASAFGGAGRGRRMEEAISLEGMGRIGEGVKAVRESEVAKVESSKVINKIEPTKSSASPFVRPPSPSPSPIRGEGVKSQSPPIGRPKVVDVKFTPRLLSPIEELREMNLIDFRRLGRDAAEIMFKIKAKIDLLGEESFAKKMEGVAAWKQSEPAKLYTALSTAALTSSQPVSVIIAEREKRSEKTLTVDEFRGIMELMKTLRF